MEGLEKYDRRMRVGKLLLGAIALVCAAVVVGGFAGGESWIARWSFGVFVFSLLLGPLIFDRCPQCGRFIAEHHREADRVEPFHCIRCGARLRRPPDD